MTSAAPNVEDTLAVNVSQHGLHRGALVERVIRPVLTIVGVPARYCLISRKWVRVGPAAHSHNLHGAEGDDLRFAASRSRARPWRTPDVQASISRLTRFAPNDHIDRPDLGPALWRTAPRDAAACRVLPCG